MSQEKTTSLGGRLRQAREGRGLSIEEAQRDTGISLKVLSDLEAGRCEAVEPVFGRMAVRTYAEYLELDAAEAEKQFLTLFGGAPPPPPRDRTQAGGKGKKQKKTGPGLFLGALAVVLLAAAAWFFGSDGAAGGATEPAAATPAPTTSVEAPEVAPDAAVPQPSQDAVPSTKQSVLAASAEPTDALPAGGTLVLADSLQLAVEGVDSTWVRVHGDGQILFEGIVPPSERRSWRAAREFRVRSGWAHGLRYTFEDKLLGRGRFGSATGVLRFRATREGVVLLDENLLPLDTPDP